MSNQKCKNNQRQAGSNYLWYLCHRIIIASKHNNFCNQTNNAMVLEKIDKVQQSLLAILQKRHLEASSHTIENGSNDF